MAEQTKASELPIEIPSDVLQALRQFPDLEQMFLRYPPSHKREHLKWIDEAKKPETRQRRIEKMIEHLQEKRR